MNLPARVTALGKNAMEGVQSVTVKAASKAVAEAATSCGAKNISLNIGAVDDQISGSCFTIPKTVESFALLGEGKTFHNIKLKSDAAVTTINSVVFSDCTGIPVTVSSDALNLQSVTIDSPNYGLLLTADKTNVALYGNTYISTGGDKAIVCKEMAVTVSSQALKNGVSSRLKVKGDILTCSKTPDESNIIFADGNKFATITPEAFEKYAKGEFTITLNGNGGTVTPESKTVYYGETIGELPIPTRADCIFEGWYTEDGTRVEENTVYNFDADITLRAHWRSGWIRAEDLPTDATVDNSKWTYDQTTRIESGSATPPSGYTQYKDPTWVWGPYGAWSNWSRTQYYNSDSRKVETRIVTDSAAYTNYMYWIYRTADGWGFGTKGYNTGAHGTCTKYDEINLTYSLPVYDASLGLYGPYNSGMFAHSGDSYWFFGGSTYHPAVTHTEWRYADRAKEYTYYYQLVESKESNDEVTPSGTISNVQKWVQYVVE